MGGELVGALAGEGSGVVVGCEVWSGTPYYSAMPSAESNTSRILDRQTLHKGAKFDFEEVTIRGPGGERLRRQVVRHPGAVVILPLLDDPPRVVFVRNDRPAVDREVLELPAGTLEPGEPPARCAARELEEETGFRAGSIEPLGMFLTTPGLTDERMHAYLATSLTEVGASPEPDEQLTVELVPLGEAMGMIDEGRLEDAKSMLAILLARRAGRLGARGFGPDEGGVAG